MRVPKLVTRLAVASCVTLLAFTSGWCADPAPGVPLPVRKVTLYRNGMGYFEHLGDVRGGDTVDIGLSSDQLNDVLKSLTVIDLGRAPIVSVTYDSTKSLERQLAELPIRHENFLGLAGLLNDLRGSEVEIDGPGGPLVGRVMGADLRKKETGAGATADVLEVMIFATGGEMRTVDLGSAKALRLRERDLTAGVRRYLEVLAAKRRQDVRRLRIQTGGAGARKLFVGYTSEAPMWKTTYRLVLEDGRKPLLQGWAIVDNTTVLDWNDVDLALVAGAPISFVQKLSEPVYVRRVEIPLVDDRPATPAVHAAPMARAPAAPQMLAPPGAAGGKYAMLEAPAEPPAQTREVGEQFEYRLPHPVTLHRNQSAMFPIVHAEVEGERLAVWSARGGDPRPRAAVWITNASGLTLAPGAFTVLDGGGFAGEGLTETIHPGERRLLSYGFDLATRVTVKSARTSDRVLRVVVRDGVLRWDTRSESETTYVVESRHARTRTVLVEHPVERDHVVVPGQTPLPVESTAAVHRFRLAVAPKSATELTVRTQKPVQTTVALDSRLGRDQLALWLSQRRIDATVERALARVVEGFEEVQGLARRGTAIDQETQRIVKDQERMRENLARLGPGAEEAALRQRYVRQLDGQETRLETLRAEKTRVDAARADAERRVAQLLKDLSLDRTL